MGNSNSGQGDSEHHPNAPGQKELFDPKLHTVIQDQIDQRYGQIWVIQQNNSNRRYALVNKVVNEQSQMEQLIKVVQKESSLQHDGLVRLCNYSNGQADEFCSSFWNVKMLFEFVNEDLASDIKKRIAMGNISYDQGQLWHILISVVYALGYLKSQGLFHQDIRPERIYINYEGKVQLLYTQLLIPQMNCFMQVMMGVRKDTFFLSPIHFRALTQKDRRPAHQPVKSDLYNLGLTLVACALLKQNLDDIYELNSLDIKQDKLDKYIQLVQLQYSDNFVNILKKLLQFDELERADTKQLSDEIQRLNRDSQLQVSERLYSSQEPKKEKPKNLQLQQPPENIMQDDLLMPVSHAQQQQPQALSPIKQLESPKPLSRMQDPLIYSRAQPMPIPAPNPVPTRSYRDYYDRPYRPYQEPRYNPYPYYNDPLYRPYRDDYYNAPSYYNNHLEYEPLRKQSPYSAAHENAPGISSSPSTDIMSGEALKNSKAIFPSNLQFHLKKPFTDYNDPYSRGALLDSGAPMSSSSYPYVPNSTNGNYYNPNGPYKYSPSRYLPDPIQIDKEYVPNDVIQPYTGVGSQYLKTLRDIERTNLRGARDKNNNSSAFSSTLPGLPPPKMNRTNFQHSDPLALSRTNFNKQRAYADPLPYNSNNSYIPGPNRDRGTGSPINNIKKTNSYAYF